MAYRWPDKDPDETSDYSVDWSRFITEADISAAFWSLKLDDGTKDQFSDAETVDGLQFVQGTLSGKVATARFALGTVNKRYTVLCKVQTSDGLTFERAIHLRITEK